MAEVALDRPAPGPVVILVQPQLGENIGTAARAMLNFGLAELRLVAPQCGWPNLKAVQACSGATAVLNRVTLFESVPDAVADLRLVLATTARPRDLPKPVVTAAGGAKELRAALAAGLHAGILFGPERTGLTNDDLLYADAVLSVPLNPAFSSLNLAQSVLLIGYEWFRAGDATPERSEQAHPRRPATKGELAQLVDHLIGELDRVDFFKTPDRRQSMVQAIKLIAQRADLREPDVHLLRGIIKTLARGERRRAAGG